MHHPKIATTRTICPCQLSALHSQRRVMPRLSSTAVFFYSFVRGRSTRRCLPAGILLFTPRRKWQILTLVSKSNYCLISVLCAHLARSQRYCWSLAPVVFVRSTSTSCKIGFHLSRAFVTSYRDMFWRTFCPVRFDLV